LEQPFTHQIDLSRVTHRHGQSPDLEPKRQRAWEKLDDRERRYVVSVYNHKVTDWELPFAEVGGAYERVLYVLVTTDRALSAEQIAYLLIARHYRNADITSIRKQLAIGVRQVHLRLVGHNRYGSTEDADEKIRLIEQNWRARRNAERVARVTRAAQLAGLDAPDLSMGPEEPEDTPSESQEGSLEDLDQNPSIEERFPGITGEVEGDPELDSEPDAAEASQDVSDEEPIDVQPQSVEGRFPGFTGEFEGDPEPESEPEATEESQDVPDEEPTEDQP
jgi:hypothetical protein